jgi:REP element-mobilizing transposase RayT
MPNYKDKKQYRYRGYDYSQDGFYFVTVCTRNKKNFFGDIKNGKMDLSDIGLIADRFWQEIPIHFPFCVLYEYIIMPNHLHGIIQIDNGDDNCRNAPRRVPTGLHPLVKNSLSSILNHYKGSVKKYCNKNNFEYFAWQPRFYDRIIRNEKELNNIRQYILDNPLKWNLEKNNSENIFI